MSDTGQKNVKKHLEGIGKFHVPYFIENAVNQFSQGTPVVFLTAYPFQQDVTGKDQGGAADSQVIANPVKLLAQLEQGFADLKAAFNGPAVAVSSLTPTALAAFFNIFATASAVSFFPVRDRKNSLSCSTS